MVAAVDALGVGEAGMARIGQVQGGPNLALLSTIEGGAAGDLVVRAERTDLMPAAARQLVAFLRTAAGRAQRR